MRCSLISVEHTRSGTLRADVAREDGARRVFDFRVDESGPIHLLVCDSVPSFDDFVGPQEPGGDAVLKALLAFHGAVDVAVDKSRG